MTSPEMVMFGRLILDALPDAMRSLTATSLA